MPKKITVRQEPSNEVPTEVLASEIVAISEGVGRLLSGRLNRKALHLLIRHAAPTDAQGRRLPIGTIADVLAGIENLKAAYLKR